MDRERAETYLRLLAEAELRRATTMAARSSPGRWHSARLALAAQALSAVGAVGADVADQIQADVGLAVAVRHRPPARGPGPDRIRLTSQRTSWRVVPVGQVIEIRDGDLRREVLVMAYAQSAHGAQLIAVGWPFRPFTAADDRGIRYLISWQIGPAITQLPLQPDPPHQIRWLDLSTAVGEPATRIDLDRYVPVPDVTVTPAAHSPGELLLDVIAARILGLVTPFSQDNPGPLMTEHIPHRALAVTEKTACLPARGVPLGQVSTPPSPGQRRQPSRSPDRLAGGRIEELHAVGVDRESGALARLDRGAGVDSCYALACFGNRLGVGVGCSFRPYPARIDREVHHQLGAERLD